jgi:hypothetical protein
MNGSSFIDAGVGFCLPGRLIGTETRRSIDLSGCVPEHKLDNAVSGNGLLSKSAIPPRRIKEIVGLDEHHREMETDARFSGNV